MERLIDSRLLKTKRSLDRGVVDSLNPPQLGLGVTGKSLTPRENSCLKPIITLLNLFLAIYFELLHS